MKEEVRKELERGFETAFVNRQMHSNLAYKPQFISNNYKEGRKVLSSIEEELLACEEFFISVAFVTMSGITPLLQTLKELEARGVQGRILTTDYLNFSEPKALKKLAELSNVELKMYCSHKSREGFHTKGYAFRQEEIYRIIVGSSNLTMSALTKNREWNTKIVSTKQGEYTQLILREFEQLWYSEFAEPYEDFVSWYTEQYEVKREIVKRQKETAKREGITNFSNRNRKDLCICFCCKREKFKKIAVFSSSGTDCKAGNSKLQKCFWK